MSLHVQPFHHAGTGTWSYLVSDTGTAQAVIIDPVLDFDLASGRSDTRSAQALLDAVREHSLDVRWLLETHAHADHLSAAQWLKTQLPQARVAIGQGIRAAQRGLSAPLGMDAITPGGFRVDGSQFDHLFQEDDTFRIGTVTARVIAVPGHTREAIAYLVGDVLFTGDSLFLPDAGSARCDFPGGDAGQLYRSIQRLFALPDATRVFVCHDYGIQDDVHGREPRCATTIGEQKRNNIHVREGIDEAAFVAMRTARDATLAPPALMVPALQANLRAGALPPAPGNGPR